MSHRTIIVSSYEAYLKAEYPNPLTPVLKQGRAEEEEDRSNRLSRFPYPVMLELSFPELDFVNRWCWQNFGPADGECRKSSSEYPACEEIGAHSHAGKWMWHWLAKTAYDFGFNEWYFADADDRARFCDEIPQFNFGENYPK